MKITNGKVFAITIIIVTVVFTYMHTKSQTVCAPESTYCRVSMFYETPSISGEVGKLMMVNKQWTRFFGDTA